MSQLNPLVLARNQSIPRIKSMPSSRSKISVAKGTTRSNFKLLSFTTTLQSRVNASPALGIGVPLADTILTGTFRLLHGILFLSTNEASNTEHVAPVSAIIRNVTDLDLSASLNTTCASKMNRLPFRSLSQIIGLGSHVRLKRWLISSAFLLRV